jgi:hypothetical protein
MSKSDSLVDSFVFCEKFNKAKSAIEKVNKNSTKNNNLVSLQKDISKKTSYTNQKETPLSNKDKGVKNKDTNIVPIVVKPITPQIKSQAKNNIVEGQGRVGVGTGSGQGRDVTRTSQGRHFDRDRVGVVSGQGRDTMTVDINLPIQQLIIYKWFLENGVNGSFNQPQISHDLKIAMTTVRKTIRKFKNHNILDLSYDENLKKFEYKINSDLKILNLNSNTEKDGVGSGSGQGRDGFLDNSSSSYIYKKTTTNTATIEKYFNKDPELAYWRQKRLSVKQIVSWINEFGCPPELMFEYLKYCRFEMVNLNIEEKKDIDNVFNWFYKIMQRSGSYPKPKGYKSHQEIQLMREREIVEQKEKETQQAKELYQRKIKAEQDKKFYDMMNNPEGEYYKKCLDLLNPIQKKSKGTLFETSMRGVFEEHFS